jgi:hypothetical protein
LEKYHKNSPPSSSLLFHHFSFCQNLNPNMERKKVSAIPYFWVLYCLSLFSSVSFLPLAPAIPSLSLSLGHLAHKRKLWSCRGGGAGGSGGGERRPSERRNLRAKGMGLPGTYGLSFYSLSLITALSLSSDFFPFPESSQLSLSLSLSLYRSGACLVIPLLLLSIVFWLYIDCLSCG